MALFRVVSEIFNVEKYRDLEVPVKGQSSGTVRYTGYGFLLMYCNNFVPDARTVFLNIQSLQ